MRSYAKIFGMIIVITLLSVTLAMAVGYEKYDSSGNPISGTENGSKQEPSVSSALEKATFADKYPELIDEFTFFIKDLLSQFGLTENKNP